jgi:twitching motility protein PilI
MAYRQSLRDLQERLAQRLTAAKSEAATASWLAVEAKNQRYLFPLVQSGEIFSWTPVQAVPFTKPWYAGVVSLRGGLYGVIDLGRLVHRAPTTTQPAERITTDARLVSLHAALGVNAVLWIDRLQGLRNASMFQSMGVAPTGAPAFFTRCLVDHQGQSWQELDLQILAAQPEFLAIAV